ncbi:GGDEF domain-containing protein, partial [Mesorhizobium sp.]
WTTALLSHALLSLLIALCLFTAAALDVLKALKAETHTDPLSGLLNRRGFEDRAALLLDQCAKAGFPVALVLADLDHFKALNDQHGHEAGDRVIADFAAKLRFATGARGAAGRIGGEEFAVLLP